MAAVFCAKGAPNQLVPKGLGERVNVPGSLSYKAPVGWTTQEISQYEVGEDFWPSHAMRVGDQEDFVSAADLR